MWGGPAECRVSLEGSKLQEMNWGTRGESLKPRNTVRQRLECPEVIFKDVLTECVRENNEHSLVYPWNNMVSSSLHFLLDCNWSRTLLFSIHVCDVARWKLTISLPDKCKPSHHLPPVFLCSGSFHWNLTYCIFNHLFIPCVKLNECVFVVRREK